MRLLLDSNVLIRVANEHTEQLEPRIRHALTMSGTELYTSVASLWEIAIKHRLGKLTLRVPPKALPELIGGAGMRLLGIEAPHVLTAVDPEPPTRDPFDRLLLAQCAVEGLLLVTTDGTLKSHALAWNG